MVQITCPVCGKAYEADEQRLKHGRQTTCSRACSYKMRADKRTVQTATSCAACGKPIMRSQSLRKSKHGAEYCSRECHYEGRRRGLTKRVVSEPYAISDYDRTPGALRNWEARRRNGTANHTDATKAKLSASTAEAIASGKVPRVSSIEYEVGRVLTELGIAAIHQYAIRGEGGRFVACVDFYLPHLCAVIEVNGTYWHADPRFYDQANMSAAQKRTAVRYAAKREHLACLGLRLIEVWEADIKQDARAAVFSALQ